MLVQGSQIYYATLFVEEELKSLLGPLLSLIWRIQRIPRFTKEPHVIDSQIHWWQIELDQLKQSNATHPLTKALQNSSIIDASLIESIQSLISAIYVDYQMAKQHKTTEQTNPYGIDLFREIEQLFEWDPIQETMLQQQMSILTQLNKLDGFFHDANQGLNYWVTELKSNDNYSFAQLIQPTPSANTFWKICLNQIIAKNNNCWLADSRPSHPLYIALIIYNANRILAWKKTMKQRPSQNNFCYNLRPRLNPLQKFWNSWRIKSLFISGQAIPEHLSKGVSI